MSQYILDIMVNSADLSPDIQSLKSPLWLIFKADGNNHNCQTPQVKPSSPVWNYGFRLIISLPDLSGAYLFVNLCTTNQKTKQIVLLGNSKVSIKGLPVGYPKKFAFPIMNSKNTAIIAAKLSLTATLSAIVPSPAQYSSYPGYQQAAPNGYPMAQPQYFTSHS
ncbi:hypothetical protein TRFO_01873 [Tritrichomonas foetus]|uniref:C2 domain-containing protein n=1 Tax=Tritrichomonas foetus TaxID=1144522 RepID=A0A1J4JMN9_9EUKA|nr:hypothetical protein TRFO_01873 [Tritrichomonas foetus]|eukprot:OHS98813.1 hypothetical protein TRFO_01873 [Tritrichomonas foetus]